MGSSVSLLKALPTPRAPPPSEGLRKLAFAAVLASAMRNYLVFYLSSGERLSSCRRLRPHPSDLFPLHLIPLSPLSRSLPRPLHLPCSLSSCLLIILPFAFPSLPSPVTLPWLFLWRCVSFYSQGRDSQLFAREGWHKRQVAAQWQCCIFVMSTVISGCKCWDWFRTDYVKLIFSIRTDDLFA
jgi:hypothetical protein